MHLYGKNRAVRTPLPQKGVVRYLGWSKTCLQGGCKNVGDRKFDWGVVTSFRVGFQSRPHSRFPFIFKQGTRISCLEKYEFSYTLRVQNLMQILYMLYPLVITYKRKLSARFKSSIHFWTELGSKEVAKVRKEACKEAKFSRFFCASLSDARKNF